ncbi:MAG: MFS transporter [Chloroflexi bacterium]|nr:MFS transporter [Chloroflexota bacterium]
MTPLSRKGTLAYSSGLLAAGIFYAFNNFTLPLYLSIYTSNAILIGWLSSTRSFEQSIVQPLIGAWSDRTRTRLGRRAPFFLTMMPLAALLLVINGLLPHDPAILWLVVGVIFLFSFVFNVGIDPYFALLADVTTTEQRGTVNGVAQVFGFVGQVILLLAAAFLWGIHPAWVFALVAAGLVVGFVVVARGVREQLEQEAPPQAIHRRSSPRRSVLEFFIYLRHLFSEQQEAVKLLGVKFLYQFGINAAAPFITLFVVSEIGLRGWPELVGMLPLPVANALAGMDAQGVSQLIAALLLVTMGLAAVPCGLLGDRFGKRRVFGIGLLLMGIAALLAVSATTIPQLILYVFLLGLGNAAQTVLFFPYLTELIPSSRVGEFTGLSAFAETSGVVFSVLLAGELINLNLFGLHYRMIFIVTGLFILLAFGALLIIRAQGGAVPRKRASGAPVTGQ